MDRLQSFIGGRDVDTNLKRVADSLDMMMERAEANPATWSLEFRDGLVELLWLAKMVVDHRVLCPDCEAKLQKGGQ